MRAARFILGMIVLLAAIAAALYFLRLPVAGAVVRYAMASAGLENPKAQVADLSLDHVVLKNVSAGPRGGEAFAFETVEARYDWKTLLFTRAVDAINIGPGTLRAKIASDGAVSLPGVSARGGGSGGKLPFAKLTVADVALVVDAPEGSANGTVSAEYDVASGGAAELHLEADKAGYQALRVENAAFAMDVQFAEDGSLEGKSEFTGNVFSSYGAVRDLDIAVIGDGRSWRDVANGVRNGVTGDVRADIRSATVNVDDLSAASLISSEQSAVIFGGPVSSFALAAGFDLSLTEDGVTVSLGDAPLIVSADNGAQLRLSENPGDPLFQSGGGETLAAFAFDLSGTAVSANGTVNAEKTKDGWSILTPVRIGDYRSAHVNFDDTSAVIRANTRPGGATADITTTSTLLDVSIGRLSVFNAPLEANFIVETDNAAGTATVTLPENHCVTLAGARLTLKQQDTEATLKDARLCPNGKPLAVIDWSDAVKCDFAGNLSAADLRYRLGQTKIAGRAPDISVAGLYQPSIDETHASGVISGGSLLFNDILIFSSAKGDFDFALDRQTMQSTLRLDRVRIDQNEKAPKIAPVIASAEGTLAGREATFDYVLRTLSGQRLGTGTGTHNVETARGETVFTFDKLQFERDGLQPDRLAPVMKGIIGVTTGGASGDAVFTWSPGDLTSKADIHLDNITFGGPTRVVTQTIGVNGDIAFASLWPVKTDGPQTITVSGVDLDALQLEEGGINFELPGDETMRIDQAEFPWFGGTLGVYEATASMTGEATAPLRADKVDLGKILDYIDVDGLSGEGVLSGVLPLVVEDGKASIKNGVLKAEGPGVLRYQGKAADAAASAGGEAEIAFSILRDLQFKSMTVYINGPLEGRIDFKIEFEGTGDVPHGGQIARLPVKYNITIDAALLELLNQARLTQDIKLQFERAQSQKE